MEKEEEEKLIEHCLELQIDENKVQVHDQETVEIQDPEEVNVKKPSSAKDPRKQLKITSFFEKNFYFRLKFYQKTANNWKIFG